MILGGQNVDIMLVFIWFSEMRMFSQICLFNDFFEKLKAEKRTWANPMSSNQLKSPYESDSSAFRVSCAFFRFQNKQEK